jgi:hypothetical protein
MMAPRVARPKTGKRAPPKSPALDAINCVLCAMVEVAMSATLSKDILGASLANAREVTVGQKGNEVNCTCE